MKINSFRDYINHFAPWFKYDEQCNQVVTFLDYYAKDDTKFEKNMPDSWKIDDVQDSFYLEKGFVIMGNVGTGKTDTLMLLNRYLQYINSPKQFKATEVWRFADNYLNVGPSCFSKLSNNNWLLDELCLTSNSGTLEAEIAKWMGNQVTMGEELIRVRNTMFRSFGLITHWTTNHKPEALMTYYGERALSRLCQMSNFIPLVGIDRRKTGRPTFYNKDFTLKVQSEVDEAANVQNLELIKKDLSLKFEAYKHSKSHSIINQFDYGYLFSLNYPALIQEPNLIDFFKDRLITNRQKELELTPITKDEKRRLAEVKQMYEQGELDSQEISYLLSRAKKYAVLKLFNDLIKENDSATLFPYIT